MGLIEIPSYGTGFARYAAESEYPEQWEGLIGAWYPFLGPSGNKLFDWSGRGNIGSLVASPLWKPSEMGSVLEFNGSTNYVTVPDAPSLDISGSYTIEAWIYQTAWDMGSILEKTNSNNSANYKLFTFTNGVIGLAWYGSGGWDDKRSTDTTPTNEWCHVVGTLTSPGLVVRHYINGVPDSGGPQTGTKPVTPTTDNVTIGTGWYNAAPFWQWAGQMALVRLYNRALTAAEVAGRYANPFGLVQLRRRVWAVAA